MDDVLDEPRGAARAEREGASERTHHAGRHRAREAERVPDRDDELADPELGRVTQLGGMEVASIQPEDREVGELVAADDLEPLLVSVDERGGPRDAPETT